MRESREKVAPYGVQSSHLMVGSVYYVIDLVEGRVARYVPTHTPVPSSMRAMTVVLAYAHNLATETPS